MEVEWDLALWIFSLVCQYNSKYFESFSKFSLNFSYLLDFFPTKLSKGYFCFDPYLHEYNVNCTYTSWVLYLYIIMDAVIFLHLQVVSVLSRFSFMTADVNFINGLERSI